MIAQEKQHAADISQAMGCGMMIGASVDIGSTRISA
jgi:hypothetical protein